MFGLLKVSIHTPRAGRDPHVRATVAAADCFNPHARAGRDIYTPIFPNSVTTFQSTRPARGVTIALGHSFFHREVSIHTPRAGVTPSGMGFSTSPFQFQSTRPARGVTSAWNTWDAIARFQSTRPARGVTTCSSRFVIWDAVSIHTPRAGRDDCSAGTATGVVGVSIHTRPAGRDTVRRP